MAENNLFTPSKPLLDPYQSAFSSAPLSSQGSAPVTPSLNYTPAPSSSGNNPSLLQSTPNYTPAPAPSTGSSAYTVKGGDTLSAIAKQNNMSLSDLLALNPQYKANPNLIHPGDAVKLSNSPAPSSSGLNYTPDPNAGLNYTPDPSLNYTPVPGQQAFTPAPNYTPAPTSPTATPTTSPSFNPQQSAPAVPQINPETGGSVSSPDASGSASQVSGAPAPAPSTAPSNVAPGSAVPDISALTTSPGYEAAIRAVETNLELSPEELATQEEIDKLQDSFRQAYQGEADRPIPLQFITGRQKSLENRQLNLLAPLQATAARLQAKRIADLEAAKFRVGAESDQLAAKRDAARPLSGTSFYDPVTKEFVTAPSEKILEGFTLGEGQARYDAQGNLIAQNAPALQQGSNPSSWATLISEGMASLNDVPSDQRASVVEAMLSSNAVSKKAQVAVGQAVNAISAIDTVDALINNATAGVGSYLANVKGTPAYNVSAQLDTIKSIVGFQALQAMRDASPTGGALGQVSEQENRLLQSTIASIDQGQSPEQLKAHLAQIKLHFNNLITTVTAPIGSEVSYDDQGRVVISSSSGKVTEGGDWGW